MSLDELQKKRKSISDDCATIIENLETIADETNRVADLAHNAETILDVFHQVQSYHAVQSQYPEQEKESERCRLQWI